MTTGAFPDFAAAAQAVLRHLHEELGYGAWLVTSVTGDDQVVVHAHGAEEGTVFHWPDSVCFRMVASGDANVAPDAAPNGVALGVSTYVGVPIRNADDTLYGTLCAIDSAPREPLADGELATVELFAGLLSSLLAQGRALDDHADRLARAERQALIDELTLLPNRRAWDLGIGREESRCSRYGSAAAVLAVDLDGLKTVNDRDGHAAGDDLLRRAAIALSGALRPSDIVARLGGDEFGALLLECDRATAVAVRDRVELELAAAGAPASVGVASRGRGVPLQAAAAAADAAMYVRKRERHASAEA
jgi:diguanylate cyclase (GGDEF)-like protein